jgi:glycerophosphoryl diester phosphodiesterase
MVIIGHRGAMGYEPENTLRSIKRGLKLGVDMIEFDVQLLKDGKVILMHDDTLDRTTNGSGFVADKTYAEIAHLNAGKGEKIPTLQEALNVIDHKVPVVIELTGFVSAAEPVAEIVKHYISKKGWSHNDISVSSFMHPELVRIKKRLPKVQIGTNMSAIPVSFARFAEETGADFVATENLYLYDGSFVKDAHDRGMKVYVYSIDERKYLGRYEKMGIDGIFSNTPDRITNDAIIPSSVYKKLKRPRSIDHIITRIRDRVDRRRLQN